MDYEEFVNFRSQFYFYCGKEFFLKEFGKKPDKERPIPRNHVVLCEMIKKRGAKVPDFYGYYNLWRSCDENVYVEYDREEKRFLFQKKFNDNLKNDELYDFVNYKISSFDGASQRFGKSVKFFKYLCAFTYASESQEKSDIDDILDKIENGEIKIPLFENWNKGISKVEWDGESKTLILKKIDFNSDFSYRKSRQPSRSFTRRRIVYKSRSRSNRESNSSSNECRQHFSSSDSNEENYAHPEDILWEYDAILNERNIDGKMQFLVKWKDVGPHKFEPSWENESMVNCIFSRKRRLPVKKLVHIEEIDKPTEVIEYYNNMKK